jgi:hypothetical protein
MSRTLSRALRALNAEDLAEIAQTLALFPHAFDNADGWRIRHRISIPRYPRGPKVVLPQGKLDAWKPKAPR